MDKNWLKFRLMHCFVYSYSSLVFQHLARVFVCFSRAREPSKAAHFRAARVQFRPALSGVDATCS